MKHVKAGVASGVALPNSGTLTVRIASAAIVATAACRGAGSSDAGENCTVHASEISPDRAAPNGIVPAAALVDVRGPWACSLTWHGVGDIAAYSPGPGTSTARFELVPSPDSAISYRDWTLQPGGRLACPDDQIEMPVLVRFTSDDGAWNESFGGALLVELREQPSLSISVADSSWAGTYAFNFVARTQDRVAALDMHFNLRTWEARGELVEAGATANERAGKLVEGSGVKALVATWTCTKDSNEVP